MLDRNQTNASLEVLEEELMEDSSSEEQVVSAVWLQPSVVSQEVKMVLEVLEEWVMALVL